MKVYFLNPPRFLERISEDFVASYNVSRFSRGVDIVYATTPPTELAILAAVVAQENEVKILDANAHNLFSRQVTEWIRNEKPDYLVIRSGDATLTEDVIYYHYAESFGIKAILWEDILSPVYSKNIMKDFNIKRILWGEPERKIFEFIERGKEGSIGGDIINDINSLPIPLMNALPMNKYTKEGKKNWYMFLNRGCGWGKCKFCLISPEHISFRPRNREHIIRELDELLRYKIETIYFWDPQINPSRQRVLEICNIMNSYPFKWEAWARTDVMDDEIATALKKAGCFRLHIGFENGNQKVLDSYEKGTSPENIYNTLSILRKYGIERAAYLCLGTPEENSESFRDTIKLIKKAKPTTIIPASYRPFPNVALTDEAQKLSGNASDFYELSIKGNTFGTSISSRTKYLSHEELTKWISKIHRLSTHIAIVSYFKNPSAWKGIAKAFLVRTIRNRSNKKIKLCNE